MKVAVTGGTGCLGTPLIEYLARRGFYIQLLLRRQDPILKFSWENVKLVTGNLNCIEALNSLTQDCDIVFHLAGKVHTALPSKHEELEFHRVNVDGTKNVLNAAKANRVQRIVFYSTVGVYGQDADSHGDELSPCHPLSAYAKTKYIAEKLVLNSFNDGGPEGVVLRFPVAYGPLDRGNVAKLIKLIHRKLFCYFGNENCLRSMISSTNASEAAVKSAFEPRAANEVFCVTDGRDYTLEELVDAIREALNSNWRPWRIPLSIAELTGKVGDMMQHVTHIPLLINSDSIKKVSMPLTFTCEKAKHVLGYRPQETFHEDISREVDWIKAMQGWK